MAKKTAKKATAKGRNRKQGTYYDKNRAAVRQYQQQRRKDIKEGKIKPAPKKKKAAKKAAPKKKKKIIGDLSSKSPEARAIYRARVYANNRDEILKAQAKRDADIAEKERLEFLKYFDAKYPPPKQQKK